MSVTPQYIWEETSLQSIWNDIKPPTYYYPVSDLYPALLTIIIITIIHYVLDKVLHPSASKYAKEEVNLIEPSWINTCTYSSQLKYSKLINYSSKKFQMNYKFPELNKFRKKELISYHSQCLQYEKHISKFLEASFKCIVFGFIYFYGLFLIFIDGKFFWNHEWMWKQDMPQSFGNNVIFNLNIYYYLQIGYHGHRASYQFFEHRRRDFWAMFLHHWVTVFLLCGSKLIGYQQIGATVLLCNDNCDLFMPAAKLCEYTGFFILNKIFTALFVILWIPLRIGVYAYKVLFSILYCGYAQHIRPSLAAWFCVLGLIIIYLLQFYWTGFLLKMVWTKLLKGKGIKDVRSDDENDGKTKSELKKHK